MKKPIIALTPRAIEIKKNVYIYNFDSYFEAIIKAGGIPLLINSKILDNIDDYLDIFDGLVITGGEDINPSYYQQEPDVNYIPTFDYIDENEIKVIKKFYESKKPILGICRGIQALNIIFGGNLHQDITKDLNISAKCHIQDFDKILEPEEKTIPLHNVKFKKGNFMYDIYGDSYGVNSFHHQALNKVAKNFEVIGYSDDNIIEAIIDKTQKNVFAVQWHPERMINHDKHLNLFKYFVKECSYE
jgi:putative glutamine amidotransferase